MSSKTTALILIRLDKGCSNCGWKEAACDIHHILPLKKGGKNEHKNLTVLCPNCHRLAHNNILTNLITLEEQVGDSWLQHYSGKRANFNPNGRKGSKKSQG
jgi:5-methylcytosine-specific restriction endonuclease McrA